MSEHPHCALDRAHAQKGHTSPTSSAKRKQRQSKIAIARLAIKVAQSRSVRSPHPHHIHTSSSSSCIIDAIAKRLFIHPFPSLPSLSQIPTPSLPANPTGQDTAVTICIGKKIRHLPACLPRVNTSSQYPYQLKKRP